MQLTCSSLAEDETEVFILLVTVTLLRLSAISQTGGAEDADCYAPGFHLSMAGRVFCSPITILACYCRDGCE